MIELNLIVIRTENVEKTVQWYSQVFNLSFVAEKHEDGILHYSAKLDAGLLEIYPTKQSSGKMTFGIAVDNLNFEKIISCQSLKRIGENIVLIKDCDGNSIIVSSSQ